MLKELVKPFVFKILPPVTEFAFPDPTIDPFMTDHGVGRAIANQLRTEFFALQIPLNNLLHPIVKYASFGLSLMPDFGSALGIRSIINTSQAATLRGIPL